jgi:phosphohistidine phosphatase
MKTLYLLRHAKADRSGPVSQDFDSVLSAEGRAAADRMAEALAVEKLRPALVLCSAAQRSKETWDALAGHLDPDGAAGISVKLDEDLYLAPAGLLLAILRALPDDLPSALLVGHNPGLHHLASRLAGPGSDEEALQRLHLGFPTTALAVLTFDAPRWLNVAPGAGRLQRVLRPADLTVGRDRAATG